MEFNEEIVFESLLRWNIWGKRKLPILRNREILQTIYSYLDDNNPFILTGIRRSGKSSLFLLLMKKLIDDGIDARQLLLINFEEPIFSTNLSIDFLERTIKLYREKINPDKKVFFFFDEIQNLPQWEKWVRREADLKEHKIFITGSSAKLLSSEISTLLTGRYFSFSIAPLSFREFLKWRKIDAETELDQKKNKAVIRNSLFDFLNWGGFPEVVLADSDEKKDKILHQYFDDILFRDIVFRHQVRDVQLLQNIAEYYFTNISSLYSFNRISNIFQTSIDNVRRYSKFLHDAYLLHSIKKFSYKLSQQQKNPQKVYSTDTGIRNAISFRFSQDAGKLIENLVANFLLANAQDVYYHRNESECDFIFKHRGQFFPIQVCHSDLHDESVKKREINGLLNAMKLLKRQKAVILTDDFSESEIIDNTAIYYFPVWRFLLTDFNHFIENYFK